MPAPIVTQELLRERFDYSPETGLFTRRDSKRTDRIGKVAGAVTKRGYWRLYASGFSIAAHRAVFLYLYGSIPAAIDHINGVRTDNRLANLRGVSGQAENALNIRLRNDNTSGRVGIHWDTANNKWRADICFRGKSKNLGRYATLEEAITIREEAERRLGFHPNHGKPQA